MRNIWFYLLSFLALISFLIWFSVIGYNRNYLQVIACDVGQGDAFLVTLKDFQILIDGGPNNKVLECLSDNMPFWDRTVEVIILSHPQKDHFGGLIDVFESYDVRYFLTTPIDSSSIEWRVLEKLVEGSNTKVINPVSGDKYRFGLIYIDILHPTEEFLSVNLDDYHFGSSENVLGAYTSKKDPNELSLVLVLSYKDFDALFTGDIGPGISDELAKVFVLSSSQRIEYIKVPHHGSKNGLTKALLDAVEPKVAVISSGKGNSYGHPHKEILEMLNDKNIKILRTDETGRVVVKSDGGDLWVVK